MGCGASGQHDSSARTVRDKECAGQTLLGNRDAASKTDGCKNAKEPPHTADHDGGAEPQEFVHRPRRWSVDSQVIFADREQTLIFLDWDDTIFPTTDFFERWGLSSNDKLWAQELDALSEERKSQLSHWRSAAYHYLDTARSLSENLVIVTNARHPWVKLCVQHFVPAIGKLLVPEAGGTLDAAKGGIRVVYTRPEGEDSMVATRKTRDPKQLEKDLTSLKYRVMRREAQNFYNRYPNQTWKNILSIGDAKFEHDAVLQVASRRTGSAREKLRTKAFLLLSEPPIEKLTLGLTVGRFILPGLVDWDGSLDLDWTAVQNWDQAATASKDELLQRLFAAGGDEEVGRAAERMLEGAAASPLLDALWQRTRRPSIRHEAPAEVLLELGEELPDASAHSP